MFRITVIVFVVGWLAWFWIDKPPPGQRGLPEVSDSIVENFQRAFYMLKAGHADVAYVYIWDAHYLLLSLLGGVLIGVIVGSAGDYLGRRRMRRHFRPPAPPPAQDGPAEPPQAKPDASPEKSPDGD